MVGVLIGAAVSGQVGKINFHLFFLQRIYFFGVYILTKVEHTPREATSLVHREFHAQNKEGAPSRVDCAPDEKSDPDVKGQVRGQTAGRRGQE